MRDRRLRPGNGAARGPRITVHGVTAAQRAGSIMFGAPRSAVLRFLRSEAWGGRRRGYRVRVLVIEDDEELAEIVGATLRRAQMAVDVTFDGTAGLERAILHDYDVIVLDRDLPGCPR